MVPSIKQAVIDGFGAIEVELRQNRSLFVRVENTLARVERLLARLETRLAREEEVREASDQQIGERVQEHERRLNRLRLVPAGGAVPSGAGGHPAAEPDEGGSNAE